MQPRDIWHAKIPSKKGWCNYSIISDFFKGNNEWLGFQVALVIKNLPVKVGDTRDVGSIPGSGRSPEVRSGNLLQYSCLKNSRQKSLKGYSLQLLLSCVWLFVSPWISAHQASLSITNSQSSLRFTSIESVMPSIHLVIWCPLLLPPIPPSIRVFSSESTLHMRWPKDWSFNFSIIPSKEIPGLISFRMDWLDLLAVQGTLKSLLQYCSSKASILWCSAFFTVQLSHPYMTTGKTIALTRRTFVGKVMSTKSQTWLLTTMSGYDLIHLVTQQILIEYLLWTKYYPRYWE